MNTSEDDLLVYFTCVPIQIGLGFFTMNTVISEKLGAIRLAESRMQRSAQWVAEAERRLDSAKSEERDALRQFVVDRDAYQQLLEEALEVA